MSKVIDGTFEVSITTNDTDKLPNARKLQNDIEEIFAAALDRYLSDKDVEGEELHFVLCYQDLTIEEQK